MNAFQTVLISVCSGVAVFVITQFILEVWIKPFIKRIELRKEIVFTLSYYADVICNPLKIDTVGDSNIEKWIEASKALRELGCKTAVLGSNHDKGVSGNLILLSNSLVYNSESAKEDRRMRKQALEEIRVRYKRYSKNT